MGKCCEDKHLIWDLDAGWFCENCKAIDLEKTQDDIDEQAYKNYYIPGLTKQRIAYHPKYHVNEIIKRIRCVEPNKPTNLDEIKNKLNGDYTLKNIYKVCKKNRKHLIYLYVEFNGLQPPLVPEALEHRISSIIVSMYQKTKKIPECFYIIDRVCKKYDYNNLREFFYIKKVVNKWDQFIDEYI